MKQTIAIRVFSELGDSVVPVRLSSAMKSCQSIKLEHYTSSQTVVVRRVA